MKAIVRNKKDPIAYVRWATVYNMLNCKPIPLVWTDAKKIKWIARLLANIVDDTLCFVCRQPTEERVIHPFETPVRVCLRSCLYRAAASKFCLSCSGICEVQGRDIVCTKCDKEQTATKLAYYSVWHCELTDKSTREAMLWS